ncbi:MAG: sulfatase-like hydrolase/transferase, partial [Candidatus Binatia bacterium]
MSRSLAAVVFALLASGCALADRRSPTPAAGFDVLLVTVDSFRPDHIGAYGYSRPITPVLDRLASRGVRFTNAYATGHSTPPSMISLATGLYPPTHGVETRGRSVAPAVDTLGDRLRAHGYRVFAYAIEDVFTGIGFDRLPDPDRDGVKSLEIIAKDPAPFFCWLHVKKPHLPYRAGEPWESALSRSPPPAEGDAALRYWAVRNGNILPRGRLAFEAADIGWIEDLYDAEVAAQDARIGEFLATLERVGRAARAIVVVTADHGE